MKYVISVDSILAAAATNMCGEFCNPNEEHVKPYGNPKAVDYHFSEEKKLLHSLLISKLPEKKTGTIELGSYPESEIDQIEEDSVIVITYRQGYNSAIGDMRKSIDELFEVGDV